MPWRFAGRAEERIDEVTLESARRWGIEAAGRYNRLIFAAINAIGEAPLLAGSRPVADLSGVRSYHLRSARRLVPAGHRVGEPRHLLIYRVAENGLIEVLSLVHDRQRLGHAALRAQREADD